MALRRILTWHSLDVSPDFINILFLQPAVLANFHLWRCERVNVEPHRQLSTEVDVLFHNPDITPGLM